MRRVRNANQRLVAGAPKRKGFIRMHDAQLPHFQNDVAPSTERFSVTYFSWIAHCNYDQLRVLHGLAHHANREMFTFVNATKLARELSMQTTHVYRALRQLARTGLIKHDCDDDGNEGLQLCAHPNVRSIRSAKVTSVVTERVTPIDARGRPQRSLVVTTAVTASDHSGHSLQYTNQLTNHEHTAPADAGCALAQSSHETGRTNGGTVSKIVGPITRSASDAQGPRQNSAPVITETKAFVQARRCALHLATLTRQPPVMDKHWQKLIATHTVDVVLEIIDEAYRNKAKVMKGDFADRNFTRQSVAYYAETYYKAKPALADRVDARTAMIITDIANTRRSDGTYDEQQLRSFFILSNVRRAEVSALLDAAIADRVFDAPNLR